MNVKVTWSWLILRLGWKLEAYFIVRLTMNKGNPGSPIVLMGKELEEDKV